MTLFHREAGDPDGSPVVLLHGGASTSATWDRLTPDLTAAGLRVLACDLPGHGASARAREYPLASFGAQVHSFADALGLDTFALVGHSLGAYTATLVAAAAPGRVTRLVLEEPPSPPPDVAAPAAFSSFRMLLVAAGSLSRRRPYDARAVASAIRQLRQPDPEWWERLATITAPALVLSGGPSSHLAPDRMAAVAAALPHGELRTIDAGHRIHSLRPDEFASLVVPFLTGSAARPRRA